MADAEQILNKSLMRSLRVIEALVDHGGPMRLQRVAAAARIPESTALRILSTLTANGYASQDPDTRRYALTLKLAYLGSRINARLNIREAARPFLNRLSRTCGESSCLAIEQDRVAVYIDYVEGPDKLLKTLHHIGRTAPLHCTGVGKTLLLNFSVADLNRYIEIKGLAPLTQNSIRDKDRLIQAIAAVRIAGCAVDDEECEMGVRCVAAPVQDPTGKVIAGISVTGPASRLSDRRLPAVKRHVIAAARQLSQRVCGDAVENECSTKAPAVNQPATQRPR